MLKPVLKFTIFLMLTSRVFCSHNVHSATGTDAKNLRKYLFQTNEYDKKIRPRINQSVAIDVFISFHLISINELSETTESLKTTSYLVISWTDEFLQWNKSDYGGLENYFWPQSDIWKPDITLSNSYVDYAELGVDSLNIQVWNTGYVYWYPFQVFRSTCSVDITYFPFDTQTCHLEFSAWSYSYLEVNVTYPSSINKINTEAFQTNSEWDLIDTSVSTNNETSSSAVRFTMKLRRKPEHTVYTIILPVLMLSLLNIFVFILPSDCGEKASYAVTVFLAFTVLLSIVSTNLPENSETVALFSVFLLTQSIQSTFIAFIVLVLIRCNSFDKNVAIPRLVQVILGLSGCKTCNRKHPKRKKSNHVEHLQISTVDFDNEGEEEVQTKQERRDTPVNNWKEIVNCFDRIFFTFFLFIYILSTSVCVWLGAENWKD